MKKILSLVMVIAMICALAVTTSAAEIPQDGLIGWFKLDGTLENAVDAENPAVPMEGAFNEGFYEDDERSWYQGVDGYAFNCSEGDGFCTNVNPGEGDFTVGLWVLEVSDPGIVPYVWYGAKNQSPENWIGIWNVNIENSAGVWDRYGVTIGSNDAAGSRLGIISTVEDSQYDLEAGVILQWTHIAYTATYVADTNTFDITMYVNGQEAGSNSGFTNPNTGDPETNGDYFYVNGVNYWNDPDCSGAIDDLVIYNKALTADEIAALYGAYGTPKEYADLDALFADMVVAEEPVETDAPETDAPETEAPETEAPTTEAPTTEAPVETEAPAEEGGCGSAMGAAALVALVATLGCAIVKKH